MPELFFPSQDVKQKVPTRKFVFLVRQAVHDINFMIYLVSSLNAMDGRDKKRGWKYENLNILRTKRSF